MHNPDFSQIQTDGCVPPLACLSVHPLPADVGVASSLKAGDARSLKAGDALSLRLGEALSLKLGDANSLSDGEALSLNDASLGGTSASSSAGLLYPNTSLSPLPPLLSLSLESALLDPGDADDSCRFETDMMDGNRRGEAASSESSYGGGTTP